MFDPTKTCDRCGRPGAVVIDMMWFPESPSETFRFTYRLCRWHRAIETKRGRHYLKFIGPLAAGETR